MKPWIVVTYRSIIYGLCIMLTGLNIYKNGIFDVIGVLTDPFLHTFICLFILMFIFYSTIETIRCIYEDGMKVQTFEMILHHFISGVSSFIALYYGAGIKMGLVAFFTESSTPFLMMTKALREKDKNHIMIFPIFCIFALTFAVTRILIHPLSYFYWTVFFIIPGIYNNTLFFHDVFQFVTHTILVILNITWFKKIIKILKGK